MKYTVTLFLWILGMGLFAQNLEESRPDLQGPYFEDSQGRLWFTFNKQLTYRNTEGVYKDFEVNTEGDIFFEDSKGRIWNVAARTLQMVDGDKYIDFTNSKNIPKAKTYHIMEDARGNIWYGRDSYEGFSRFDTTWHRYKENVYGKLDETVSDKAGNLWSLDRNHMSYFDGEQWNEISANNGSQYIQLYNDKDGHIICLNSVGVSVYKDGIWKHHFFPVPNLKLTSSVLRAQDSDKRIWLSIPGGLLCFDGEKWLTFDKDNGLNASPVVSLHTTIDGKIAVGQKNALSIYDGTSWVNYDRMNGLNVDFMRPCYVFENPVSNKLTVIQYAKVGYGTARYYVYENEKWSFTEIGVYTDNTERTPAMDKNGHVYFSHHTGNAYKGFVQLTGTETFYFDKQDGLANNTVNHLFVDAKGKVWFSMGNPITRKDYIVARYGF